MCKEVKPDLPSRTGFFSRKKKTGPVLQRTKLLLKGRIFLHNITDIITGSDSGTLPPSHLTSILILTGFRILYM